MCPLSPPLSLSPTLSTEGDFVALFLPTFLLSPVFTFFFLLSLVYLFSCIFLIHVIGKSPPTLGFDLTPLVCLLASHFLFYLLLALSTLLLLGTSVLPPAGSGLFSPSQGSVNSSKALSPIVLTASLSNSPFHHYFFIPIL